MYLIVCENYDEMSKRAAELIAAQINENPESVLGLATGSTAEGVYKYLSDMNRDGKADFKKVTTFNLDEYYPLSCENEQSYHYFMNKHLFSHVNIDMKKTHIPDGAAADPQKECREYEEKIAEAGGIDLQLLGIGRNGHIGFNEPDNNLYTYTHLTKLTENTIEANSRFFENESDVPKHALTMGIGTILKAKKILLLASGKSKHNIINKLLNGEITTELPASMLKVHPDVTIICDKDAFSEDMLGVDIGGTDIKFGVVNSDNEIIYREKIAACTDSKDALIDSISEKCKEISEKYPVAGIGFGIPGSIKNGYADTTNLPLKNVPIEEILKKRFDVPIYVLNDANCAAVGECAAGMGKDAESFIMITLGTGIGGGIIVGKKLFCGRGNAGEFGQMSIKYDGAEHECGICGCWEDYASVSALIKAAEEAARQNADSILYRVYSENKKLDGKMFFDVLDAGCKTAQRVFDEYLKYLSVGINNLIQVFDPEMIVISGGITNAGDRLLKPLNELTEKYDFAVPIYFSKLKNDAGVIGAARIKDFVQ